MRYRPVQDRTIDEAWQELANDSALDVVTKAQPFLELMTRYRCALMEIETKFKVLNEEFSVEYNRNPFESIKTRLKKPASIIEKLKRKGYPLTMDSIEQNLADIAGVRVICSFPEDIYILSEMLLRQDDIVLIEKKDYIANPKPNGYRNRRCAYFSLHGEKTHEGGGAVPHDRHGFLGKSGS